MIVSPKYGYHAGHSGVNGTPREVVPEVLSPNTREITLTRSIDLAKQVVLFLSEYCMHIV